MNDTVLLKAVQTFASGESSGDEGISFIKTGAKTYFARLNAVYQAFERSEAKKRGETFYKWFSSQNLSSPNDPAFVDPKKFDHNLRSVFKFLANKSELRFVAFSREDAKDSKTELPTPEEMMSMFGEILLKRGLVDVSSKPSQPSQRTLLIDPTKPTDEKTRYAIENAIAIATYGSPAIKQELWRTYQHPIVACLAATTDSTQQKLDLQLISKLVPPSDIFDAAKSGLMPAESATVIIAFLETEQYTFGIDEPDKLNLSKVDLSAVYNAIAQDKKSAERLDAVLKKVASKYVETLRSKVLPIELAAKWIVSGYVVPNQRINPASKALFEALMDATKPTFFGESPASATFIQKLAAHVHASDSSTEETKKIALFVATALSHNDGLKASCALGWGIPQGQISQLGATATSEFAIYDLALKTPLGYVGDAERKMLIQKRAEAYLSTVYHNEMDLTFALQIIGKGVGSQAGEDFEAAKQLLKLGSQNSIFIRKLAGHLATLDPNTIESSKIAWFLAAAIRENSDLLDDEFVASLRITGAGSSAIAQAELKLKEERTEDRKKKKKKKRGQLGEVKEEQLYKVEADYKADSHKLARSVLYRRALSPWLSLSSWLETNPDAGVEGILTYWWPPSLGDADGWKLTDQEKHGDALSAFATMLTEHLQKVGKKDDNLIQLAKQLLVFGRDHSEQLTLEAHYAIASLEMALEPSAEFFEGKAVYLASHGTDAQRVAILTHLIQVDSQRAFQVIHESVVGPFLATVPEVMASLPPERQGSILLYYLCQEDLEPFMMAAFPISGGKLGLEQEKKATTFWQMFETPIYDKGSLFDMAKILLRYCRLFTENRGSLIEQEAHRKRINEAAKKVYWNDCSWYTLKVFYPWKYWVSFRFGNWISGLFSGIPLIGKALGGIGVINTIETLKSKFRKRSAEIGTLRSLLDWVRITKKAESVDKDLLRNLSRADVRSKALDMILQGQQPVAAMAPVAASSREASKTTSTGRVEEVLGIERERSGKSESPTAPLLQGGESPTAPLLQGGSEPKESTSAKMQK